MKAGQTELEVGTKVRIKGITGQDACLNGITGTVTHPFAFGCTDKEWIGIYSDEYTPYGYKLNVTEKEVELL